MSALFWLLVTVAIGGLMVWAQDRFPDVGLEDQRKELEDDTEQCSQHLRERIAAMRERSAT